MHFTRPLKGCDVRTVANAIETLKMSWVCHVTASTPQHRLLAMLTQSLSHRIDSRNVQLIFRSGLGLNGAHPTKLTIYPLPTTGKHRRFDITTTRVTQFGDERSDYTLPEYCNLTRANQIVQA